MKRSCLLLCALFVLNMLYAQKYKLEKLWETDSVLKVPESVLFDGKNNVLYVANIEGTEPWGKDGKGSIGKLGTDGNIIAVEWVTGLDAPKGMGLYKDKLYVADLTNLVVIDIKKGIIEKRIAVEGAQGLNDVTVDKNGIIYVSDSRGRKVYRVKDEKSEIFLENLKGPNGVLMHGKDFYVLDAGGMYKVKEDMSLQMISEGMEGGTDGIEHVQGGDFIVSCWQGIIWYVQADGTRHLLLDTRGQKKNSADIGFDAATKTVFVPTFWRNTVAAYRVSEE